jgi:hypothetical protein
VTSAPVRVWRPEERLDPDDERRRVCLPEKEIHSQIAGATKLVARVVD